MNTRTGRPGHGRGVAEGTDAEMAFRLVERIRSADAGGDANARVGFPCGAGRLDRGCSLHEWRVVNGTEPFAQSSDPVANHEPHGAGPDGDSGPRRSTVDDFRETRLRTGDRQE